jgi:hypothetical protein
MKESRALGRDGRSSGVVAVAFGAGSRPLCIPWLSLARVGGVQTGIGSKREVAWEKYRLYIFC